MQKEKIHSVQVIILSVIVLIESFFIINLLGKLPKKHAEKKAAAPAIAKIAIVLDDWGYNLNNLSAAEQIKYPFTASVLPNLPYSHKVAEELHSRGFEIILHLPMEPHEKYRLEKNTILTTLDEQTIDSIIGEDLASIAYAKGVSNHMGSKATENSKTMESVLKELKKRHLYFLDSLVTSRTVCADLASKIGISFAKRDVFLDNIEEQAYIKRQINILKLQAKSKGIAVGIGHDRKITLEVLKEAMPQLEKEGYKLVRLSEIAR